MAYVKIMFQDSPSTATPLNAENLNHMDDQIALNDQRLTEIETSYVKLFNGRTGNVVPEKGDYDINQIVASDGQDGYIPVWRNNGTEQEPDWGFAMEEQGGSGHEIQNQSGTLLPQEDILQFPDSHLTDDETNGRTIVENIKEVSPVDYDSTTDEGIIVCDDGDDAVIGAVSDDYVEVTADGVKTYQALLNEIFNDPKFDITKISEKSTLKIDPFVLYFGSFGYYSATFNGGAPSGHNTFVELTATIETSDSNYNWLNVSTSGTTSTDKSTDKPTSGTKLTLYYGNKKATVDLQTTANRCWYDSENTVKQKIDTINSTLAQELYEEHTTREGSITSDIVNNQNANFLTEGYYTIVKNHKQITVRIAGISSKTNYDDWILGFKNGYRPAKDEYFTYCLGSSTYTGHVTPQGYIRFHDLNTTDVLSATITFNIA